MNITHIYITNVNLHTCIIARWRICTCSIETAIERAVNVYLSEEARIYHVDSSVLHAASEYTHGAHNREFMTWALLAAKKKAVVQPSNAASPGVLIGLLHFSANSAYWSTHFLHCLRHCSCRCSTQAIVERFVTLSYDHCHFNLLTMSVWLKQYSSNIFPTVNRRWIYVVLYCST